MSKRDMYGDFDPYEMMMNMHQTLISLQQAHNGLANAYEKTQHDYRDFLVRYKALEESHLALANAYMQSEMNKLLKNP